MQTQQQKNISDLTKDLWSLPIIHGEEGVIKVQALSDAMAILWRISILKRARPSA